MAGSWLHRPALVTFGWRTCASVDWSISSSGCLGSVPSACLILAQFIVYVVSAVSWAPVSFRLAWMSAVVAWGLASSSCASNLWVE